MKRIDGKLLMKDRFLPRFRRVAMALALTLTCLSCAREDVLDIEYRLPMTAEVTSLDEDISWADAIVTVRRSTIGRSYFQLGDDVSLEPVGWENPFSDEVMALVAYSELDRKSDLCSRAVSVERIDPIVTSDAAYIDIDDEIPGGSGTIPVSMVRTGYDTVSALLESSSPVDVVSKDGVPDWMTFSEDGYLIIHFATFWGDVTKHSVNLYASQRHPDHLYLVHKDNGDYQSSWEEGLVAFRVCQLYMSRKDEYRDQYSVVLHWMSFSGEKTMRLKFGNRAAEK